jgi:2-polyprenyl-3-methyl-5-hydroxy-6-metoxy-1,4-benzoquinol methylase
MAHLTPVPDPANPAAEQRRLWDAKADFWDQLMGAEGNEFHRTLVGPTQNALLALQPGETLLDIACGNGLAARELARTAGRVVACDGSPRMVELARARAQAEGLTNLDFSLIDATDESALRALGEGQFDAVLCSMAIMDLPEIDSLLRATRLLLKPSGRFVFSLIHPCFNHHGARMVEELEDHDGALVPTYSVRVTHYLNVPLQRGVGARGEPIAHYYFHRTLTRLFGACFAAGFVLDALEEPAFLPRDPDRRSFTWANYSQIPPVLVARLQVSSYPPAPGP